MPALVLPLLLLLAAPAPASFRPVGRAELPAVPLDLAFLGRDRVLALLPDAALLLLRDGEAWREIDRVAFPPAQEPIRLPGGLLSVSAEEQSVWVMVSGHPLAELLSVERGRLLRRGQAPSLPWPGAAAGLRFAEGTSLLEGEVDRLGPGPFLRLATGVAVRPDGTLSLPDGADAPRVGSALASLGPDAWVAASPRPPGASDELVLLRRQGATVLQVESFPVQGAVRAPGARAEGGVALLAVGLAQPQGAVLLVLEMELP